MAKVELDNGTILYYKPHSLDKNIKYQELYNYLCRKTGISCRTVQYLSHDSYGWEEKIENIPCKNESEVEHYYFRMGIHLFWDMPLEQQIFMVKILSHMENIL